MQLYLSPERRANLVSHGLRNAGEITWEHVLESFWTADDTGRSDVALTAYRSADPRLAPGVIALDFA